MKEKHIFLSLGIALLGLIIGINLVIKGQSVILSGFLVFVSSLGALNSIWNLKIFKNENEGQKELWNKILLFLVLLINVLIIFIYTMK